MAPRINHIFFADDNLNFCKANKNDSDQLLFILHTYAIALEQCINKDKIQIVLSTNVKEEVRGEILAIFYLKEGKRSC